MVAMRLKTSQKDTQSQRESASHQQDSKEDVPPKLGQKPAKGHDLETETKDRLNLKMLTVTPMLMAVMLPELMKGSMT